ncbi:MAG TPA: R3H domain-containing nucleic acid-binding protein [Jatrophihabitans sp.]|uniref:Jag family protein n=1 Tax=Jatrophihabitans sp. TaxID=1932789 RepID=UPI002DF973E1|nr:R3H domain-containing nucleic acid-binding protein [Jatrophihabitans sp.]
MSETDTHAIDTAIDTEDDTAAEAIDEPTPESGAPTSEGRGGEAADSLLVREGDIAADYLERLLDIVDYDGDIDLDVENDRAAVAIVGSDLQSLVGGRGETLDALQELTRLAVQQQTGVRSRLMLDVSGHRQARRAELQKLATDTAARVLDSHEPVRLAPMNPFERKVVHDAIATVDGVVSESEGEEPHRRVVVLVER